MEGGCLEAGLACSWPSATGTQEKTEGETSRHGLSFQHRKDVGMGRLEKGNHNGGLQGGSILIVLCFPVCTPCILSSCAYWKEA